MVNTQYSHKIRYVAWANAACLIAMLYQTSEEGHGTLVAILSMAITFLLLMLDRTTTLRLCSEMVCLLTFVVLSFISTVFGNMPTEPLMKLYIQIGLCIAMFCFSMNEREYSFTKTIFKIIIVGYSILLLRASLFSGFELNLHKRIELFGTYQDPNFVGIPIVAATPFVLKDIIERNKVLLNVAFYVFFITTLVVTASRGSTLSLLFSNTILLYLGLKSTKSRNANKLFLYVILGIILYFTYIGLSNTFGEQIERVTTFDEDSDNGRLSLWVQSLSLWQEHPFFGSGINSRYILLGKASHNTYLELLCETGLFGLTIMLVFFIKILKRAFHYDVAFFAVLVGMLFQIAFLDALNNRCVWGLLCWAAMLPNLRLNKNH